MGRGRVTGMGRLWLRVRYEQVTTKLAMRKGGPHRWHIPQRHSMIVWHEPERRQVDAVGTDQHFTHTRLGGSENAIPSNHHVNRVFRIREVYGQTRRRCGSCPQLVQGGFSARGQNDGGLTVLADPLYWSGKGPVLEF